MKLFFLVLGMLVLGPAAHADNAPPALVDRASYEAWLGAIGSPVSAFSEAVFHWYFEQVRNPLPAEVAKDPDKLYVNVARPMQQTIALEQSGDIEEGTTYGLEAYGLLDADSDTVLEAKLFGWGKPIGRPAGTTYPVDTVFPETMRTFQERWSASSYYSTAVQTGGGVVRDLRDSFSILLRGNKQEGYVLYTAFLGQFGDTQTTSHFSVVTIKPTMDGKTEFRQLAFQNGQSYAVFGIEFGRRNFGFNYGRVREGEKNFLAQVMELKATGKITEKRPDLQF